MKPPLKTLLTSQKWVLPVSSKKDFFNTHGMVTSGQQSVNVNVVLKKIASFLFFF